MTNDEVVLELSTGRKKPRPRRYSLFEKQNGKWVRLSQSSFFKRSAVQVFQSALLSGYFEGKHRELRPVKGE